jgi:tetratricopeptide (TPR) repeat protein
MANAVLTNTQSYANFFRRRVLSSTQHWRTYVAAEVTDTAALDRGRNQIVRAILFALELEEAWPAARELIETLSPYMERRGEWGTWNPVLSRALEAARRSQDRAGMVSLSALLARLLQRQSRFRQAIAYYRYTIHSARQIEDRYNEARACSNLGYLYVEQSRWWRAEILCCHALAIFEQLESNHGRAHTENHLGVLYTRQSLWERARQLKT